MKKPVVTVVGGSGFVGRYVVRQLADAGYTVRVLCRYPVQAGRLRVCGNVGQVVPDYADLSRPETLKGKLNGSHAVINLVGILYEKGRQRFARVQAQGAEKLAQEARAAGVECFIHVSALGIDKARRSHYARSKLAGEQAVRAVYPKAVILRPSVIFGPEDNFFNQFARLASYLPALPAIGGGKTRFQPVYVDDVAKAILAVLQTRACLGGTYELGGPNIYTLRQIMEMAGRAAGHSPRFVPLPFALAGAVSRIASLAPAPMLTADQVRLLQYDNIVSPEAHGFAELGIAPASPESIIPHYLAYRRGAA